MLFLAILLILRLLRGFILKPNTVLELLLIYDLIHWWFVWLTILILNVILSLILILNINWQLIVAILINSSRCLMVLSILLMTSSILISMVLKTIMTTTSFVLVLQLVIVILNWCSILIILITRKWCINKDFNSFGFVRFEDYSFESI